MKFQSILLALSAASVAVACPPGKKPKTSAASSYVTPSASQAPTGVPYSAAGVSPSPAPSSEATSVPVAASSAASSSSSTSASASAAASDAVQNAASTSSSSSSSDSSTVSGEATFYGGNLSGGTCSFTTLSTIPNSLYGTAFSGSSWDSGAECGACVEVTGPDGNSITAMVSNYYHASSIPTPFLQKPAKTSQTDPRITQIVDQCPECEASHLDLFEDAFLQLGTASEGIIDISYKFVDCGITAPLVLHNKSGTSAYWFSMQVVGANGAVDSLEVSTDGGSTWQSTTRTDYNYFENTSGFGTDTVDVRVTSASGTTVTVSDVSCASESQTTASSNF